MPTGGRSERIVEVEEDKEGPKYVYAKATCLICSCAQQKGGMAASLATDLEIPVCVYLKLASETRRSADRIQAQKSSDEFGQHVDARAPVSVLLYFHGFSNNPLPPEAGTSQSPVLTGHKGRKGTVQ